MVIIHIPRADGNTNPMEKRELSSYLSVLRRLWRRLLTAPALLAYLLLLVLVTVTTAGESLLSGDGFITPSEPLPYLLFKYLFFPFLTFLIALYYYRCHHRPEEGKEDIPVYNPRWEGLLILFLYFLWLVFVATKLLTNRYLLPLNHILANFLEGSSLVSLWFAALLQFFAEVLVVKLLPAVIIFKVLFRYRWRDLGVGWHWGWTVTGFLALLVAGALLWRREPAPGYGFLLGNFLSSWGQWPSRKNFYRGLMQPRLERFFAEPSTAWWSPPFSLALPIFPISSSRATLCPRLWSPASFIRAMPAYFSGFSITRPATWVPWYCSMPSLIPGDNWPGKKEILHLPARRPALMAANKPPGSLFLPGGSISALPLSSPNLLSPKFPGRIPSPRPYPGCA